MTTPEEKYCNGLAVALKTKEDANDVGRKLASLGTRNLVLIGCGASNRIMASVKYWVDIYSTRLKTSLFFPAEFICQNPPVLDDETAVILMSDSGKTEEILQAARFIKENQSCKILSITSSHTTPLAGLSDVVFAFGETNVGFEAKFIVLLSLISSMMEELGDWELQNEILASLDALPLAMADAEKQAEKFNAEKAAELQHEDFYFAIGSGPCYPVVYSLGICVMMEALWIKVFEGQAAEFFHGPFEALDESSPVILFIGEDPSRPIAERAENFIKKHTEKRLIYDSKAYEMNGISENVRPIMAPYILGAASIRFAEHLADYQRQPLSTRRYMGKETY